LVASFVAERTDDLKDAGVFAHGEIVEDLSFFAQCSVRRGGPRIPRVIGTEEAKYHSFKTQERDFVCLYPEQAG